MDILFCGKRKDNHQWMESDGIFHGSKGEVYLWLTNTQNYRWVEVEPESVKQIGSRGEITGVVTEETLNRLENTKDTIIGLHRDEVLCSFDCRDIDALSEAIDILRRMNNALRCQLTGKDGDI